MKGRTMLDFPIAARKCRTYLRFFHCTPRRNVPQILQHGLLPWRDRRKKGRVWLARLAALEWAFGHVMETHSREWEDLAILEVCMMPHEVTKHRRGVYYVTFRINPIRIVVHWPGRPLTF
jgi:hypothetical protein